MQRIKVLFLVADPSTTTRSEFEERVRVIRDRLQEFRNLVFDSEWATSVNEVYNALDFHQPRAVHFVSLACAEKGIALPLQVGGKPVVNRTLALRFSRFSPRLGLVILDGCYPSDQAKALDVFDCVIGVNDRSDASNTLRFATFLYRNISIKYTIQRAFDYARSAMPSSTDLYLLGKKPTRELFPPDPEMSESTIPGKGSENGGGTGIDPQEYIETVRFKRRRVFICYYKSLEDEKWLHRLQAHLTPLECEGITNPCGITKTPLDAESEQNLRTAIETAKVTILLVSAEFLASGSIMNNQLSTLLLKAQSEGTTIIPLVITPCSIKRSKQLKDFQPFNPTRSLAKLSRTAADGTLDKLADVISKKL